MKILVTGAAGALGRNLVANLKTLRDGKNRTRPNLQIGEIYEYSRNNTEADLDRFCADCDFVVHAAGVNRPKEVSEFMEGNFGFTSTLLDCLKRHGNKAPIMITSSVQATLSGRFGDSEYGRSKLAGEELLFRYGEETGAPVYVYRFENMVGKWIRPRYNSAVGTFCYCIARGEAITVNDPSVELEMLFIDDLIEEAKGETSIDSLKEDVESGVDPGTEAFQDGPSSMTTQEAINYGFVEPGFVGRSFSHVQTVSGLSHGDCLLTISVSVGNVLVAKGAKFNATVSQRRSAACVCTKDEQGRTFMV